MQSTFKLIRRFIKILLLSVVGLFALNVVLFLALSSQGVSNAGGWEAAKNLGQELQETDAGFVLSKQGQEILKERHAWAILVEDGTGNVIWKSDHLPEEIPLHYSVAEISYYTRGYIADYPTTTASRGEDLMIVGHPKTMYWKHMTPTFDYALIAHVPQILLIFLCVNLVAVFFIYWISVGGVLRSVNPIVTGIEALPAGKDVYIQEKGLLSDLACAINRVSEKLMRQDRELKKKETARANWISGVSHDIRTPLSMVMGYAGQMEEDASLSEQNRKKAAIIRQQSTRIKNLVNDLNLASKLEYHMQPMHAQPVNLVAVARQCIVDYLNLDLNPQYTISCETGKEFSPCIIEGDKELIRRAINNLIDNSICHNPDGCTIVVSVAESNAGYQVSVEDNGVGVTEKELDILRNTPHYMMNDSGTREPRHGLGLLIVQQIVAAHGGSVTFSCGKAGGFRVQLQFPKLPEEKKSVQFPNTTWL